MPTILQISAGHPESRNPLLGPPNSQNPQCDEAFFFLLWLLSSYPRLSSSQWAFFSVLTLFFFFFFGIQRTPLLLALLTLWCNFCRRFQHCQHFLLHMQYHWWGFQDHVCSIAGPTQMEEFEYYVILPAVFRQIKRNIWTHSNGLMFQRVFLPLNKAGCSHPVCTDCMNMYNLLTLYAPSLVITFSILSNIARNLYNLPEDDQAEWTFKCNFPFCLILSGLFTICLKMIRQNGNSNKIFHFAGSFHLAWGSL